MVALVCAIFLFHMRSALVAIVSLPIGILASYLVMYYQGVNANIMSLGGIAIAIGAMVDAAVVMIENAHKHIERWEQAHPRKHLEGEMRWIVVTEMLTIVKSIITIAMAGTRGQRTRQRWYSGCMRAGR